MNEIKLPNSEDGKLLAAFIKNEIKIATEEIIKELKSKTTTKK